jgi:O-antigen/teichoic acid export membrane protein
LSGTTLVTNVAITLVLTHLTGVSGYGQFAFALAASSLLGIPAVLGLAPLVVRNVAAYQVRASWGELRGIVRRAHQAVLISSVGLAGLAALAGFALRVIRPSLVTAYWIGLVLVPITALASIRQAAIQGLGRVVLARVPDAVLQPILFLAAIGLFVVGDNLDGATAVGLYAGSAAAALILGWLFLRRTMPPAARTTRPRYDTRTWARSALPLTLLSGIQLLNEQTDVLLLGTVKGSATAGVFGVTDRVAGFVAFFLIAALYPLGPAVARLWEQRRPRELQRLVTRSARLVFMAALLSAAGLIGFRHAVLGLFGSGFTRGEAALTILILGQLVNTGCGTVGLVLMMTGHEAEVTRCVAAGAAAGVVLNIALIPPFGLVGAAAGTATGVALSNVMLVIRLRQRTGIWAAAVGPLR